MTESSSAAGIPARMQRGRQTHFAGLAKRLPILQRLPFEKFIHFAAVGGLGTAAHYLVLGALVELAGTPVLAATTAGAVAGAVVNYVLNRRVTFTSDASHAVALPKFLMVATAGAGLNWVMVALLLHGAGIHYVIAQLAATATVLLLTFAGNHLWTFRE